MTKKILIVELKQETANFNPVETTYDHFQKHFGADVFETLVGTDTEIGGALEVWENDSRFELIPGVAAWSVSGGHIPTADLDRLIGHFEELFAQNQGVDGVYFALHGAMSGETEDDPEGRLLLAARKALGDIPFVMSLDLHAIVTDRMIEHANVIVPYHTYPHVDMHSTGQRAAKVLTRLLEESISPVVARVKVPILVRGDELITATGLFGQAIRQCQQVEDSESGLAAGVFIGNPFTDVPDLRTNVLITTNGDRALAESTAQEVAQFMWDNREKCQAPLTSLTDAISLAADTDGLTAFSDAADATASGAPGDSNAILRGLVESDYSGRALMLIVDAPAALAAHQAGIGGSLRLEVGAKLDPERHQPLQVEAIVKSLSDGSIVYENGTHGAAGATAVVAIGNHHVVLTQETVFVVGQKIYKSQGLDPVDYDIVVLKSPNGFRPHYESIVSRIVPVDVPGSTSANLLSLPFTKCPRPMFPLDEGVTFENELEVKG